MLKVAALAESARKDETAAEFGRPLNEADAKFMTIDPAPPKEARWATTATFLKAAFFFGPPRLIWTPSPSGLPPSEHRRHVGLDQQLLRHGRMPC